MSAYRSHWRSLARSGHEGSGTPRDPNGLLRSAAPDRKHRAGTETPVVGRQPSWTMNCGCQAADRRLGGRADRAPEGFGAAGECASTRRFQPIAVIWRPKDYRSSRQPGSYSADAGLLRLAHPAPSTSSIRQAAWARLCGVPGAGLFRSDDTAPAQPRRPPPGQRRFLPGSHPAPAAPETDPRPRHPTNSRGESKGSGRALQPDLFLRVR